jgi:microsomal dipeptidase-like Zn-dependent dipeptidase|tara:strand:+ start:73858 stop:74079 length:222 start_codon:yes stop_codon:yes gene_type:complete
MREGGLDAVHVTVCCHEDFRQAAADLADWNRRFQDHQDLIMPGRFAEEIPAARQSNRAAVFFGFQNCSPLDIL